MRRARVSVEHGRCVMFSSKTLEPTSRFEFGTYGFRSSDRPSDAHRKCMVQEEFKFLAPRRRQSTVKIELKSDITT